MLEEADRLTLLTSTLLELTRAEGGRRQVNREPIDLRDLVNDAAAFFGMLAEEGNVRLVPNLPASPLTVLADWTVLRQALINVLDNAIKHSPPGTAVTIAASAGEGTADIVVTDQGPGIPPEHREHVFERFYRADASRSSKTGGFGLGLAIARWAVETHGGRIELESGGQGSTFRIRVPHPGIDCSRSEIAAAPGKREA